MKIALYAENHSRAGQRCRDEALIERRSDDLVFYEGSPSQIREHAKNLKAHARTAFHFHSANELLDAADEED